MAQPATHPHIPEGGYEMSLGEELEAIINEGKPVVTINMSIDNTRYGAKFILDKGFPVRFVDEEEAVRSAADHVAEFVRSKFIEHFTIEDGAPL